MKRPACRHTTRTKARLDELAEELALGAAIRLRRDADSIRDVVAAVVDYLIEEYPSQDLYIPSGITYPVEEIREAVRSGKSMRWICNTYRTDRRTIYALLDASNEG